MEATLHHNSANPGRSVDQAIDLPIAVSLMFD